jgi:hypothetical protein
METEWELKDRERVCVCLFDSMMMMKSRAAEYFQKDFIFMKKALFTFFTSRK